MPPSPNAKSPNINAAQQRRSSIRLVHIHSIEQTFRRRSSIKTYFEIWVPPKIFEIWFPAKKSRLRHLARRLAKGDGGQKNLIWKKGRPTSAVLKEEGGEGSDEKHAEEIPQNASQQQKANDQKIFEPTSVSVHFYEGLSKNSTDWKMKKMFSLSYWTTPATTTATLKQT